MSKKYTPNKDLINAETKSMDTGTYPITHKPKHEHFAVFTYADGTVKSYGPHSSGRMNTWKIQ